MDEQAINKRLLPDEDNVKKLFESVVAAINKHPDEIKLFVRYSYNSEKMKKNLADVTDIFVNYFKGLELQYPLEAYEIKLFPSFFTKKLKSIVTDNTIVINTQLPSKDQTLDYIGTFITSEIANDENILSKISEPSREKQTMDGTGLTSGSGEIYGGITPWVVDKSDGGKRRPRRNSSSTHRRRPSRKSSATKRRRSRRPHRRTSRK